MQSKSARSTSPEKLANTFLIGGAVLFAVSPESASAWWLFLFFLTGHIVWTWHGYKKLDRDLVVLNGAMIALDLYAILIRI